MFHLVKITHRKEDYMSYVSANFFQPTRLDLFLVILVVDGKWTVWGNWGICSLTCGGGVQDRSRTCTNPPPAFGGAQCVGPSRSTRLCNDNPCPGNDKTIVF